jgi:hypothetical protein
MDAKHPQRQSRWVIITEAAPEPVEVTLAAPLKIETIKKPKKIKNGK